MNKDKYYIETLARGLQILEVFSKESPSLSLTQIVSATGLNKSTVFRFVHTLEKLGYLERDPDTKRYRPGLKVLRLGFTALNSLELATIAYPYLKALSDKQPSPWQVTTTCLQILRDASPKQLSSLEELLNE